MKKILLITGVVMGIVVVHSISKQTLFPSNDSNHGHMSIPMDFRKGLSSAKSEALADGVEKRGNPGTNYFVIANDTGEVLKGWRPSEK